MGADLGASLGGLALFLLAGLGVTELFSGLRRLSLPYRLAYAWLLGVAALAGGLYAFSHFFHVPLRRPAIFGLTLALLAAGGVARLARRRRGRTGATPPVHRSLRHPERSRSAVKDLGGGEKREVPPPRSFGSLHSPQDDVRGRLLQLWRTSPRRFLLRAAFFLVAAAVSLGVLADAVSEPVRDWDGRMTWSAQARYVRADGTVDASALLRPRWYISHPKYPLLLPVAQVVVLEAAGAEEDNPDFRAVYAAFLPALLLVLHDAARRWAGGLAADLAGLAAAAVPFFAFGGEGGAVSAYSDLPLACFYGAGVILLLRSRRWRSDGIVAGLLLGAAVLTKNEGTPLALMALAAGGLAPQLLLRRRRGWTRLAAAAGVVVLALALLLAWRAPIPNREDENYAGLLQIADFWPGVVTRIATVGPVMLDQMLAWEHWGGFWWTVPLVLLAGWQGWTGRRRILALLLLAALAGPLAIAWAAYSVHWYPEDLARVTWNRLLLQAAIPFFLLLALALRRALEGVKART